MKKLFLSIVGGSMMMAAYAADTTQVYFAENFADVDAVPSEWIQYGVDAVPSGSYSSFFGTYTPDNGFRVNTVSNGYAAFSPAEFKGGVTSDQWLITPEISIEEDEALVVYTAYVLGTTNKTRYKVLLSDSGAEKENFTEQLINTTITGKGGDEASATRRLPIEGYKGKKVRLAFVNTENTSGMVGFGDITVGQYYLQCDPGQISHYVVKEENHAPAFDIKLSTPVYAEGVTAVLEIGGGETMTYTDTNAFSSSVTTSYTIKFRDALQLKSSVVDYILTITPNFEGAQPTVLEGQFIKSPYEGIVLMEEYTGTWCANCPRGIAYMNWYSHDFGRKDGKGHFIGVALHQGDPMQPSFFSAIQAICPSVEYPSAYMNRNGEKGYPTKLPVIETFEKQALGDVRISRVDYTGSRLKVNFATTLCYDEENPDLRAFVYVTENDVTGTGAEYAQHNGYWSYDEAYVAFNYCEEVVPYFAPFINRTNGLVPASEMKYQEVGRGVYPSVTGSALSGSIKQCVYNVYSFEFSMPSSVLKDENVNIAVIILDNKTGEVLMGDVVGYENFNKDIFVVGDEPIYPEGFDPTPLMVTPSGNVVNEISADASLAVNGHEVVVNVPEAGLLTIYGVDGTIIEKVAVEAGVSTLRLDVEGLVFVRLSAGNATRTLKVIL